MSSAATRLRVPSAAAPRPVIERVGREQFDRLLALVEGHAAQRADRGMYGVPRASLREFEEALFDPPFCAWAWIATHDGEDLGYAAASVGFSVLERGYHLCLEALHARIANRGAERELLRAAADCARELGCVNLQWRVTAADHDTLSAIAPHRMQVVNLLQHVLAMPA